MSRSISIGAKICWLRCRVVDDEIDEFGPTEEFLICLVRNGIEIPIARYWYDEEDQCLYCWMFDIENHNAITKKIWEAHIMERIEYDRRDIDHAFDKVQEKIAKSKLRLPFDEQDYKEGQEEFERAIEEYGGYRDED